MSESLRHDAILELLEQKQYISVPNVIETFGVSPATARRDINKLSALGKLRKVRNGAQDMQLITNYFPLASYLTE